VLEIHLIAEADANLSAVGEAVAPTGATFLTRTTGNPISRVEVYIDGHRRRPVCRAIDLDPASSDLLAPCCATCTWWLARPA
jgi:hypothetical protein